jgi:hypothetical protein
MKEADKREFGKLFSDLDEECESDSELDFVPKKKIKKNDTKEEENFEDDDDDEESEDYEDEDKEMDTE